MVAGRRYSNEVGNWAIGRDYIYRGSRLLAAETPSGRRHYHLDHLGTPRLITYDARNTVEQLAYYPFGEQISAWAAGAERMKFTGHERDGLKTPGTNDDLDYMHARYCSPGLGRFLSLDPVNGRVGNPQSWNRYGYSLGNPLRYIDPDGRETRVFIVGPSPDDAKGAFGHAALLVESNGRSAGVSYGGDHDFKDGAAGFVAGYTAEGRTVTVFTLKTTPDQDESMADFIETSRDGIVDREGLGADLMLRQNCTTAVCNTLIAGGLAKPGDDLDGAMSLLHTPAELLESLEEGTLSSRVTEVAVISPATEEPTDSSLDDPCAVPGACSVPP